MNRSSSIQSLVSLQVLVPAPEPESPPATQLLGRQRQTNPPPPSYIINCTTANEARNALVEKHTTWEVYNLFRNIGAGPIVSFAVVFFGCNSSTIDALILKLLQAATGIGSREALVIASKEHIATFAPGSISTELNEKISGNKLSADAENIIEGISNETKTLANISWQDLATLAATNPHLSDLVGIDATIGFGADSTQKSLNMTKNDNTATAILKRVTQEIPFGARSLKRTENDNTATAILKRVTQEISFAFRDDPKKQANALKLFLLGYSGAAAARIVTEKHAAKDQEHYVEPKDIKQHIALSSDDLIIITNAKGAENYFVRDGENFVRSAHADAKATINMDIRQAVQLNSDGQSVSCEALIKNGEITYHPIRVREN